VKVAIAGSSGFLGTALREHLHSAGHNVVRLVRSDPTSPAESRWDPYAGQVDAEQLAGCDVVVNLAGVPIARPWTAKQRRAILRSRVATTRTLAVALAGMPDPPAFLAQSGIDFYGDRGAEVVDESSPAGAGFLAGVTRAWEDATLPASAAGVRVCRLRTGVVLDASGGALRLMLVPFRLGAGGRLGSGRQYMSAISLTDWVRATYFLMKAPTTSGAFNVVAPHPPTNAELTAELGRALHRPTRLAVPSFALRKALGGLSATLLSSVRAHPARLTEAGYTFQHPDAAAIVGAALHS
jgi:uncharacterized protein (TIGR01777 family)